MEAWGSAACPWAPPSRDMAEKKGEPLSGRQDSPAAPCSRRRPGARVASLPFLVGWGSHVGAQGLRACGSPCSPELQSLLGGEGGHRKRRGSPGLMRDHLTVPAPLHCSPSQPHKFPGCPPRLPPHQAAPQPPTLTCPQSSAHLPITLAVPRATAEPRVSAERPRGGGGPGLRWPQAGLCAWPSLLAATAQGLTPDGPFASSAPHGSAHLSGGPV